MLLRCPGKEKRKKEKSISESVFIQMALVKLLERSVVTFVPLMCHNDGQQRDVSRAACFKSVSS